MTARPRPPAHPGVARLALALLALLALTSLAGCGPARARDDGGVAGPGAAAGRSPGGSPRDPGSPAALSAAGRARADSLLRARAEGGGPPVGLDVVRELRYPRLRFDPPSPERFELSNGVPVFFLEDPTLPLVDVFIRIRGGYESFPRERYAAASGLLPLMRVAGTEALPPDSVDERIERNALGVGTAADGASIQLAVSGLRSQLDLALDLWSQLLLRPRFDSATVEGWRLREIEAVRRFPDMTASLAVSVFNQLLYGDDDHPAGWRMTAADLAADRVTGPRLMEVHRRVVCPENAIIGAAGDVHPDTLRAALERALAGWIPCGRPLPDPAHLRVRWDSAVHVIHRPVDRTTIVVGQPGQVRLEETDAYFASRVANWILGGSGFTSRLVTRLRTEEGLAYSAATVWGTDPDHERILGAITHTRPERTVETVRATLQVFREARADPPSEAEVALARDAIANGFVFGFSSPVQIVARQVAFLAQGLPDDWLARYLAGIRAVRARDVATLLRERVHPDRFTILVVGDTTRFDAHALGDVVVHPAR